MKGIAHFVSGLAAVSFFPVAVEAAQAGNPLYFLIGGAAALLPDSLDFKFYRFFYRYDRVLALDPRQLDFQVLADGLADALRQAAEQGRFRVKLNTLRLGADLWRQYRVHFDQAAGLIRIDPGPAVSTGQVPQADEAEAYAPGAALLPVPVRQGYDAVTTVDIFDGPGFEFLRESDGVVRIHFLPWHRSWSHSVAVALVVAAAAAWLAGLPAGWVALTGFMVHVLEDQLGFMGSALFFPFSTMRVPGLHWMRSGDALPNLITVWLALTVLFWNLLRFGEQAGCGIRLAPYLLMVFIGPLLLMLRVRARLGRRVGSVEPQKTQCGKAATKN